METAAWVIALIVTSSLIRAVWQALRQPDPKSSGSSAPPPQPLSEASGSPSRDDVSGSITEIMLGHAIAKGHTGFPGDPLPGGQLGTPASLSFWGSMYDDDEDE